MNLGERSYLFGEHKIKLKKRQIDESLQYFIASTETTAKTLLDQQTWLSSGCSKIDAILQGGFSRRGITQIYGEAGSGKTQLALQLCMTTQNTPISSGALYICTENRFPITRMREMIAKSINNRSYQATTDLIYVEHIASIESMIELLTKRLPIFLKTQKIGLIVIDSITAPFRAEYSDGELKTRARILRKIGLVLHQLSSEHDITVICINQVSAAMNNDFLNDINSEKPCLGVTWANHVTNSIHMYRREDAKFLRIVQSSYIPRLTIEIKIYDHGVFGVDPI